MFFSRQYGSMVSEYSGAGQTKHLWARGIRARHVSLAEFMREVGLNSNIGGRGDAKRLCDQMVPKADLTWGQCSTFNEGASFAFVPESQRLAIIEGVRLRERE